ncbi:MAG TPA: NADH-quinone oxidoreductase subunit H [Bacteroidales bacterium]|nr:NADH-quinone oxidoreductase subunit H [Bacteroidales bacterium]
MMTIIFILIAALFFPGIILRSKSIFAGRKGPGLFQPIKDIALLFQKGNVISTTTSAVFKIAPAIGLASVLSALLVLPFGPFPSMLSFNGDIVFFAYMLALGKFFLILAALDTGSAFEGMGANREALYSLLTEPAFFILIGTLAMLTGYTSFNEILVGLYNPDNSYILIYSILSVIILAQIMQVENSRLPVDDPKTHLELTMIHEVMILDYSGFDKALIHITTWLKFALYSTLIFDVLIPIQWNIEIQLALFALVIFFMAVYIGFIESFKARHKLGRNPAFLFTISSMALLAFVVVLILTEKMILS